MGRDTAWLVVAIKSQGQEPAKNKAEARNSKADRLLCGHPCASHSKMVMVTKFQPGRGLWNHCDVIQVTFGAQGPRAFVMVGELSGHKPCTNR